MHDVTVPMLWLPIVLSAVAVMIGSTVIWMALKYENAEWKAVPSEDKLIDAVRGLNLPAPGQYIFPHMVGQSPDLVAKKMEEGPVGVLLLRKPAKMNMGGMLFKSFIFYLVVSFFVAYVASHALSSGTDYLHVFQIAGTCGFMAYGLALVPEAIWFGRTWKSVLKGLVSALILGSLTAGTFGWLWPR
jgi:hypothetical protein